MDGGDIYCALCGAMADFVDEDDEETYDNALVSQESMQWLGEVRILYQESDSTSPNRPFLTSTANYQDNKWYSPAGFDPVFEGTDEHMLRVYDWWAHHDLAIPMHEACYDVLCKAATPQSVDLEMLYEVFKAHCSQQDDPQGLDIDYGPIKKLQEQYWLVSKGTETFVSRPTVIPGVDAMMSSILGQSWYIKPQSMPPKPSKDKDMFATLPSELLLEVLDYLDIVSIGRLRVESRQAMHVTTDNMFWKKRINAGMGWALEFLEPMTPKDQDAVDWLNVYKLLKRVAEGIYPEAPLGLVNRSRIWAICTTFLDELDTRKEAQKAQKAIPAVLLEAVSSPMPRLIQPQPHDTDSARISFVDSYAELAMSRPLFSTFWTQCGSLAGISVNPDGTHVPETLSRTLGDTSTPTEVTNVEMPADDWLTGLIATTRVNEALQRTVVGLRFLFARHDPAQVGEAEGDLRLFVVREGHFIVGLGASWANKGTLGRLALLQQPLAKAPDEAYTRLRHESVTTYNPDAMQCLWRDRLPPPRLRIHPEAHGYWAYDFNLDARAMEGLVFGTSVSELAQVTALAADVAFSGFQVHFADGSQRAIGPRHAAMKTFRIDGPGGERIMRIYVTVANIPSRLRFVTNRGRQLVLGQATGQEVAWPPDGTDGLPLGLYGVWSKRGTPQADLEAVGVFSSRVEVRSEAGPAVDVHGYHWDGAAPTGVVAESDRIHGLHERYRQTLRAPGPSATVSWLDCSKPLESVKVALCHGAKLPELPLVGMTFQYADGTVASIGPSRFDPPTDSQGEAGHYWCWCSLGQRCYDELAARPHYQHSCWRVDSSSRLKSLRIWLHDGCLSGIQLMASDGTQSPQWGYCQGETVDEDLSPHMAGRAKGLKFFVDINDRRVSRDDFVVVALQTFEMERV